MADNNYKHLTSNILNPVKPDDTGLKKAQRSKSSFTSIRRTAYRGKSIKVRTTYSFEIDGEPVTVPIMVRDDGRVHCHGIPSYVASSALDLARRLVDTTPASLPDDQLGLLNDKSVAKRGKRGKKS